MPAGYVSSEFSPASLQAVAAGKTGAPEVLVVAGKISLDTEHTNIRLTQAADVAFTLADGEDFQRKTIAMTAKSAAGNAVVTVANLQGGTTLTFNAVADFIRLIFVAGKWQILTNVSVTVA